MKKRTIYSIITAGVIFSFTGCHIHPARTDKPIPLPEPTAEELSFKDGVLVLDETKNILSGMVAYRIYANGVINYHGNISFTLGAIEDAVTKSFEGTYKADPKSILSKTYKEQGNQHKDYKVIFVVDEVLDNITMVKAVEINNKATGNFRIDTSENIIDIISAEVKGKVMGLNVTFNLVKE